MYTANPRVNVELRQRLPPPATQQPSNSTQQPSNSTQQPINSTQQPINSTQQPSNSTQQPSNSTQQPSNSTQLPSNSTQQPINSTQQPINSTQQPSNSTQQPSNSTQLPSNSTQQPINSTQQPINSTHQPSNSTHQPSNSTQQPRGAGRMDVDVSPSRGPSPWAEVCGDVPGVSGSHLVSSHQEVVFGPITASGRVETFDQDKNVSFLLKELDNLREINKKEDLVQKEMELQRREGEEELRGERREAHHWERPEAVLGELLAAQKDRDQALMSRLLLANEERDEALLRVRQMQQAAELESFPLEDADMDVSELLQRVCGADSVRDVQQFGSVLVQRLRSALQRRSDITAQEMKAVMEERDGSVTKCKRLEQEVMREREQRASEMELLRLQRERGGAMEGRRWLEAELQLLRANHSGSVSPAASLAVANQTPLHAPPPETPPLRAAPPETPPLRAAPPEIPPLQEQVQQLWKEKQSVEAELQRCQEAEREASERVRRLERLVEVLRKKVGTGSLRAVI
ncbi:mirror-image polydactyly gene 1 protein isoform X2 [Perca flavescens]|uniref:mirror-image polydactyly gene 1 protein isoform X2 n=1 Tax=Perca flavescens TaxID=8167 RepID=UPI00106E887F|nr:mirror-image polydactyly gene 1 protein-like isoform X2 [Perca flavescens]